MYANRTVESLSISLVFPVRYYFIDFELGVRFSEDSKVEDRVVTGLPIRRLGLDDPDDYGRDISPEMLSGAPYDPFKTDVFQMGLMFYHYFCVNEHLFLIRSICMTLIR